MAYITLQDMRNEGVKDPPFSDAWVTERIRLASSLFEIATGRYFERRDSQTFLLDGSGSKVLRFVIPPVATDAITSVTLDGTLVDSSEYQVIIPYSPAANIHARLVRLAGCWRRGSENIAIVGSFGVVDEAGQTPYLVKDAIKRIATLEMPQIGDADARRSREIIEEEHRDYRYKLSDQVTRSGSFGDRDIDRIVATFKPIGIAAA